MRIEGQGKDLCAALVEEGDVRGIGPADGSELWDEAEFAREGAHGQNFGDHVSTLFGDDEPSVERVALVLALEIGAPLPVGAGPWLGPGPLVDVVEGKDSFSGLLEWRGGPAFGGGDPKDALMERVEYNNLAPVVIAGPIVRQIVFELLEEDSQLVERQGALDLGHALDQDLPGARRGEARKAARIEGADAADRVAKRGLSLAWLGGGAKVEFDELHGQSLGKNRMAEERRTSEGITGPVLAELRVRVGLEPDLRNLSGASIDELDCKKCSAHGRVEFVCRGLGFDGSNADNGNERAGSPLGARTLLDARGVSPCEWWHFQNPSRNG